MANPVCVVMAGGQGSRLRPVSTPDRPKPFLPLAGDRTLLEDTLALCLAFCPPDRIHAVVSERHLEMARGYGRVMGVPDSGFVGEPEARGTLACAALALGLALGHGEDSVLVLLPADQWIGDTRAFGDNMRTAIGKADAGAVCVMGVPPQGPDTRYGYIETDGPWDPGVPVAVRGFTEKPDPSTAAAWAISGRHLWNCGMTVMGVGTGINGFVRRLDIDSALFRGIEERGASSPTIADLYGAVGEGSFDRAFLEGYKGPLMAVPASFPWSDAGTWEAVGALPGGRERIRALFAGLAPDGCQVPFGQDPCGEIVHGPRGRL